MKILLSKNNLYWACVVVLFTTHSKTQELFYSASEKITTPYFKSVEPLSASTTKFNYGVTETSYSTLDTTNTLIKLKPTVGFFPTIEAMKQVNSNSLPQTACEGASGNQLVNPSFELPEQSYAGNNILEWPEINGWYGEGFDPNIVRCDGVVYAGGPRNAQEGSQYLDIAGGEADFYQEFDFQCNTKVFFSGYFSVRDFQTSTGRIDIVRVNSDNTTEIVASSNQLNMPSTAETWYLASGNTVLPKGRYRFQISMSNTSNFDNACFSFDYPNIETGSYDPLCESSSSITLTGTPTNSFGTWTGSGIIDNGDGTASFNPSGLGGTAVTATYSHFNASGFGCSQSTNITVNPVITPIFTQVAAICNGGTLNALPTTSDNNITGTWSPAMDNTLTTTYTFTPDASETCEATETMTITVNPLITPTFTQVAAVCNGGTLDALPTISNNNITGTWSPAMDNTLTTTYTFSPDTTQPAQACAVTETMTITVNPLITPTFTQVAAICDGGTLDALPTSSNNNITGTWSLVMDNMLTTTYIFTPDTAQPGQACAVIETMTITVNPVITPIFTQVAAICNGGTLNALTTLSNNNITGTWSPAMNNTLTTTYTFSPDTTQPSQACAVTETMTITVNPLIIPTFTQVAAICNGGTLDALPISSDNNITGIWSPAMDNTLTTTYTFSPDTTQPGQACAVTETMTITVNPLITPTFTQVAAICNGGTLDALPTSSDNNITGTWSPAMDNMLTTTYTFTPDASETCAVTKTMTITVNPLITPIFAQVAAICNGGTLDALPTTSNNNVIGTWSPAMDNTLTTTYTFSPDTTQPGQACAVNQTTEITVNQLITPTFTQVAAICNGDVLAALPTASNNNVIGIWSPAIDNTATTIYTFTPDTTQPGQACAVNQMMTITVNPITPIFAQVAAICNGGTLDALPTSSDNNITGTWSPAMNNTLTTTYIFIPDTTQPAQACAVNQTMTITVNPLITPIFAQVAAICNGGTLDALLTTSDNNITGTWSPAMDNTLTTTYTFTPDTTQPAQACAVTETMTITVNPLITPIFAQVAAICNGGTLDALPTTSDNNITGAWSPAIDNTLTTTYTFTPDTSEICADLMTLEIVVNNIVNSINSIRVKVNLIPSSFDENQSIEVIASGGTAPYEYKLENGPWQDSPIFNDITDYFYVVFVREKTACNNQPATSVQVINHPVFFTPNNDGFNDIWNIKGLEVKPEAQITIYNRYGKIITIYKSTSPGWDGLYNGKKMPSNDYWFTIEYIDTENIPRVFRSHFSLIR